MVVLHFPKSVSFSLVYNLSNALNKCIQCLWDNPKALIQGVNQRLVDIVLEELDEVLIMILIVSSFSSKKHKLLEEIVEVAFALCQHVEFEDSKFLLG